MRSLRSTFWILIVVSLAACCDAEVKKTKNVLLICVDDLKPTIRCYGDPIAITPNIDRLAARGVRFDYAYCNQAVCAPSRNSLMTGLRPQTIGVYDLGTHFRLAVPDAVTFSQHFMKRGYHAQGLGKIYHTGHGNINDSASWSVPIWRPKAPSYALKQSLAKIQIASDGSKRGPPTESAEVPDDTYSDGKIAREAAARIAEFSKSSETPFFLAVGFLKPHLPFVAPKKYWDLYEPSSLPMPAVDSPPVGAPSYAPTNWGELRKYAGIPENESLDQTMARKLIHGYYASTSYVDAQVGLVLDALDRSGMADQTIIVLWGDHGWHLGDHGMWCKHTNYEQAARIPFIISAPSGAKGACSDAMIETVDIYPTVAELASIDEPLGLDGQSQAKVVIDPTQRVREFVTHVYPRGTRIGRAVRNQRYRLVEWKDPRDQSTAPELELYDYQIDPLETKNLAVAKKDIVTAMQTLLAEQPEAKPQWKQSR